MQLPRARGVFMPETLIGIIGGSGLYHFEGLSNVREMDVDTPFGKTSDSIMMGSLEGRPIAFLSRHGRGHRINPTQLPVRANVFALKSIGVEWLISISAVGSLKEELAPQDLVVPDQLIDRTRLRENTFFEDGIAAHVGFADPFCPVLGSMLHESALHVGARAHMGGTMVVMEGPAFSTRAECAVYRSWGADIIGMTALPEAKLAREAEMCYSTLACVTDYDCWREETEVVTVEMVVANLMKNISVSKQVLNHVVPSIPRERTCPCASALKDSIITAPDRISQELKDRLKPLVEKYL